MRKLIEIPQFSEYYVLNKFKKSSIFKNALWYLRTSNDLKQGYLIVSLYIFNYKVRGLSEECSLFHFPITHLCIRFIVAKSGFQSDITHSIFRAIGNKTFHGGIFSKTKTNGGLIQASKNLIFITDAAIGAHRWWFIDAWTTCRKTMGLRITYQYGRCADIIFRAGLIFLCRFALKTKNKHNYYFNPLKIKFPNSPFTQGE